VVLELYKPQLKVCGLRKFHLFGFYKLSRGSSQAITITPSWTSTVYSEGYAIDYNKNGLFTDAGAAQ
jgi:hypothetical protein